MINASFEDELLMWMAFYYNNCNDTFMNSILKRDEEYNALLPLVIFQQFAIACLLGIALWTRYKHARPRGE